MLGEEKKDEKAEAVFKCATCESSTTTRTASHFESPIRFWTRVQGNFQSPSDLDTLFANSCKCTRCDECYRLDSIKYVEYGSPVRAKEEEGGGKEEGDEVDDEQPSFDTFACPSCGKDIAYFLLGIFMRQRSFWREVMTSAIAQGRGHVVHRSMHLLPKAIVNETKWGAMIETWAAVAVKFPHILDVIVHHPKFGIEYASTMMRECACWKHEDDHDPSLIPTPRSLAADGSVTDTTFSTKTPPESFATIRWCVDNLMDPSFADEIHETKDDRKWNTHAEFLLSIGAQCGSEEMMQRGLDAGAIFLERAFLVACINDTLPSIDWIGNRIKPSNEVVEWGFIACMANGCWRVASALKRLYPDFLEARFIEYDHVRHSSHADARLDLIQHVRDGLVDIEHTSFGFRYEAWGPFNDELERKHAKLQGIAKIWGSLPKVVLNFVDVNSLTLVAEFP